MDRVILKHSILAIDNQLLPVDVLMWGELKLTSSEIESLTQANINLANQLIASNVSITPITETINKQSVFVGVEMVVPNLHEFQNTDAYKTFYSWVERMRDDPDITVFNWIEELD